MEQDGAKAEITAMEVQKTVPGIPFQKGNDPRRNLEGRPKGALDFKTKWEIFVDKVAKQNNMTPDQIDEQLLAVGFKKAKEGDYSFYRDIHDRVYGKPIQKNELTGKDGENLVVNVVQYKDANNTALSILSETISA